MRLREIVVSNEDELIYSWQTDEKVPERFDEFKHRVQCWLDRRNFKLGEGTINAVLTPPYVGETISRMEYHLIAPRIAGSGPFPLVDLISC